MPPHPPASRDAPDGHALPAIARASVQARLRDDPADPPRYTEGFLAEPHPAFVTLRDLRGRLRGCIGTLAAKTPNIVLETWHLAREAAFADSRFPPVLAREFADLRFEVSVLSPLETIPGPETLDPRHYGVVVETPDGRRGALLPDIEGIDTVEQQLAIVRRKAGIQPGERVRLRRFTVASFEEPG